MYLAKIIVYISILVWLLPPFKQLKGGFFLYFLILGYSDPLALLLGWLFKLNSYYLHLIVAFLLALSILYYNKNLNIKWIGSLTLILILSLLFETKSTFVLSIIIFRIFVIVQIFIIFIKEFFLNRNINFYFSILLLYELTTLLKYTAVAINYTTGIYMFFLSLAFEILIGIFFIFYNIQNSPRIKLPFDSSNP
jgi:hypothetical protein